MNLERESRGRCRLVRRELAERADDPGRALSAAACHHLQVCSPCRERAEELGDICTGLRGLPLVPLPHPIAAAILRTTSGLAHDRPPRLAAQHFRHGLLRRAWWLAGLGAAAAVALALPAWQASRAEQRRTQQAADEAQLVLALAAGAMERVEHEAIDQVLGQRVPGVLGQVLMRVAGAASSPLKEDRR